MATASASASASANYVWELLEHGDLEVMKAACPSDFRFTGHHPVYGVSALHLAVGVHCTEETCEAWVAWVLDRGADPNMKTTPSCFYHRNYFKLHDKTNTTLRMDFGGTSGIELAVKLMGAMKQRKQDKNHDWSDVVSTLARVVKLMGSANQQNRERVLVDVGIVEMWEELRQNVSSHDVVLETAEGDVTAHRIVLERASLVLRAMLASGMREGSQQRVQVRDSPKRGAAFFLDLLYAGTSSDDLDAPTVLAALDLAHRWEVHAVVRMLEGTLVSLLTNDNFVSIAEVALLKGSTNLANACRAFASSSKVLETKRKAGKLPKPVLDFLGGRQEAKAPPAKKRRSF